MKQSCTEVKSRKPSLWLCFACSALIHILAVLIILPIRYDATAMRGRDSRKKIRFVTLSRDREKEQHRQAKQHPAKEPSWVKTSPDQESLVRPKRPDYIGTRHTVASGNGKNSDQKTEHNLPNSDGEKERGEIVLFDQKRQDGSLGNEGECSSPISEATLSLSAEESEEVKALASNKIHRDDSNGNVAPARRSQPKEYKENRENAAPSLKEYMAEEENGVRLTASLDVDQYMNSSLLPAEMRGGVALPHQQRTTAPSFRLPYDPSFTASSQPGFRTTEKRTRTTGRFVLGSKPSLNVEKTPKGMYQALIYRRIAYYWYKECDANRDMIIPGSLQIRLLVNIHGQIASVDLVKRAGASVSQQGFTFRAVRCAEIPPMPTDVQRDIVGDKMELIFDFYFD